MVHLILCPYFLMVHKMVLIYTLLHLCYGHPGWSESQNIFDPNGDNYSVDNIEGTEGMKLMIVMVSVKVMMSVRSSR